LQGSVGGPVKVGSPTIFKEQRPEPREAQIWSWESSEERDRPGRQSEK
jgi:hypothetical protein